MTKKIVGNIVGNTAVKNVTRNSIREHKEEKSKDKETMSAEGRQKWACRELQLLKADDSLSVGYFRCPTPTAHEKGRDKAVESPKGKT